MGVISWILSTSSASNHGWLAWAVAGVAAHHALFIRGEWHLQAPKILTSHLLMAPVLLLCRLFFSPSSLEAAFYFACRSTLSYVGGLLLSIATYRLFFHRLRSFPGPLQLRISKLLHVLHILDGKNHIFLENIRKKHGEFVRTGPNELTVFHQDIHWFVDGPRNTCSKSSWYDVVHPDKSLVSVRDRDSHAERRRLWLLGLSPDATNNYQASILRYCDRLVEYLQRAEHKRVSVNVTDVYFWLCWDIMGEVTFSKPFDMLRDERQHESYTMLKRALSILGVVTPAPWAFHIAFKYLKGYWVVKDWDAMKSICRQVVQHRLKDNDSPQDIFRALISNAKSKPITEGDMRFLNGDALVGLVAGSDPTGSALVFLFLHIAKDQDLQQKLRAELNKHDVRDAASLRSCELLVAVIKETLRLYPPLMTGGMRDTGPEGLNIGGVVIPPHVTIISPRYSISRLDHCFSRPTEFLPERWTSHPELNPYPRAFNPFGLGAHSCVGKNLVWHEVCLVTAAVLTRFSVRFGPGEDGERVFKELKDYVAPSPGPLRLVFEAVDKKQ